MYKKGSLAIQKAIQKLFETLPEQFGEGTKFGLDQIKEEFDQFLENHTIRSWSLVNENGDCLAKVQLQAEISSHLEKLKAAWGQEIIVPVVVEEKESEEEDINVDDLSDADDGEYIDMSSDEND